MGLLVFFSGDGLEKNLSLPEAIVKATQASAKAMQSLLCEGDESSIVRKEKVHSLFIFHQTFRVWGHDDNNYNTYYSGFLLTRININISADKFNSRFQTFVTKQY